MFEWLESTVLSELIRRNEILYPAISALHITGIAALYGSVLVFDLALITSKSPYLRYLTLPVAKAGFLTAVFTGLLLFVAEPVALAVNVAFIAKLILITLALLNIILYQTTRLPLHGMISIFLWTCVIFAGRWIAYSG